MAYKVLGQSAVAATTNTDLYTVPSGKSTVASTLTVCNRSSTSTTYRVAVRPSGAAISNEHYVLYDNFLDGGTTHFITIGMTVTATDVVTVYANDATVSFSIFGDEV